MDTQQVTIFIKGGMVQRVEKPEAVVVVVKDYDTENSLNADLYPNDPSLHKDEDGREYFEAVWK